MLGYPSKEAMIKVLETQEAKNIFEELIKNVDVQAYTSEGIIRNYELDHESVEWNPMGGINFTLIINHNKNMYVGGVMNKQDDKLRMGGYGIAGKLVDLIEKNKKILEEKASE